MAVPAGAVYIGGVACTPDGAVYVTPTGTAAITGGTITGTNVPYTLAQSAIPFIHISSGSIGNNGALTGVTALPATYSSGAWCYFPANAIAAGVAAGWYWVVFSSTTAGTIYNSTYAGGAVLVGTQIAFSTTGPGAYTGDITERAGPQITVPANALGPNGQIEIWSQWGCTNSVGTKSFIERYSGASGSAYLSVSVTTVAAFADARVIRNRGVTNSQVGFGLMSNGFGQTSAADIVSTADTTTSTAVVLAPQKGTATDNAILSGFTIKAAYAP